MKKHRSATKAMPAPAASESSDVFLRFSFRLLQSNRKFGHEHATDAPQYLHHLLRRLQAISAMRPKQFRSCKHNSLRAHLHRWQETTEPDGFAHLTAEWTRHEAWQFQLSANKHGRVHGILVDEVFYIVWLDPEHRLYQ
jgi:hypothetical protein